MTIDDKFRDEKLLYAIKREAAKISAFSSGKINKYEYLAGEEILPPDKNRMIEQGGFIYAPLRKLFQKTNKNDWDQGKKQVEDLKALKSNA